VNPRSSNAAEAGGGRSNNFKAAAQVCPAGERIVLFLLQRKIGLLKGLVPA
jgi:hypothetical protein